MKLITLHTSPSVAIENHLTQMFKALVPLVLNFSRSSKVRIAPSTTSRYPWHPRSVKMVRWHHVTPLCPTPVRGSSRGAQGCQQMYSRDLDPSSRQPDERTQKYIIAYHVYYMYIICRIDSTLTVTKQKSNSEMQLLLLALAFNAVVKPLKHLQWSLSHMIWSRKCLKKVTQQPRDNLDASTKVVSFGHWRYPMNSIRLGVSASAVQHSISICGNTRCCCTTNLLVLAWLARSIKAFPKTSCWIRMDTIRYHKIP